MSCLNLKLFPSTKAWRIFTKKLQLKLNKPKLIKKPKTRYDSKKTCKKLACPASLSVHPKKFKIIKRRPHHAYIQKTARLPVFVDQLFVEQGDSLLKTKACDPQMYHSENSCSAVVDCEKSRVSGLQKNGVGNMDEKMSSADEMWESLGMGSSQMERIDERAEEFITKFRAEMQNSENSCSAVVDCKKSRVSGLQKNGVGNMDEKMGSADEMLESLGMGSSQMERIDERAEEFITKFRAEMQNQETLARYL